MLFLLSLNCLSQKLNIEEGKRYFYWEKEVAIYGIDINNYDFIYIISIKNGIVCCTPTRYDKSYGEWFNMDKKFCYKLKEINKKMVDNPLPLNI